MHQILLNIETKMFDRKEKRNKQKKTGDMLIIHFFQLGNALYLVNDENTKFMQVVHGAGV